MRTLAGRSLFPSLPFFFLLAAHAVRADDKPANAPPTPTTPARVDASDTAKLHGDETGAKKNINVRTLNAVETMEAGTHRDRTPVALDIVERHEAGPSKELIYELIQKQMRRNHVSIAKCTHRAHRHQIVGSVVLHIRVADHNVVASSIGGDTINDHILNECLLKASRGWTFGVTEAEFDWQVDAD